MTTRCGGACACGTAWLLRFLLVAGVFEGLALVIFGAVVERPVTSTPTVCMILLGVYHWATSALGLAGASRVPCTLELFIGAGVVGGVLSVVLVAELWLNHDGVLAAVGPHATPPFTSAHVGRVLRAAQWLLLLFLIVRIVALALAVVVSMSRGKAGRGRKCVAVL